MKIKLIASGLLSLTLVLISPSSVSAQQSMVVRFVSSDCQPARRDRDETPSITSISLKGESILLESTPDHHAYLFTAEALFVIEHKRKSYRVERFDELEAKIGAAASEITKSQGGPDSGQGFKLKLTRETDTISGLKARKLVMEYRSKPHYEFYEAIWVSSDLLPVKLRALSEKLRALYPEDSWSKGDRTPGMAEIIMLYGIPLRMVSNQGTVCNAQIVEGAPSNALFEVPEGYKRREN